MKNQKYILVILVITILLFGFNISYTAQELVKPAHSEPKEEINTNSSLTQSEIRKLKKWEVAGFGASDLYSGKVNYNATSRFTIGYTHVHQRTNGWEPVITLFPSSASLGERESRSAVEISMLNLRYYLLEKIPFYITVGAGRNFFGEKIKSTRYGYLYQDGSFNQNIVVRETTISPYNFIYAGIGFQWVFQSGFLLGIEYFRVNSNRTSRSHITFLDPKTTIYGLMINTLGTGSEKKIYQSFYTGDFWIGYAFSF